MLEAQKKVIDGVSYSKELFKKELLKSFAWLDVYELRSLRAWVVSKYYHLYPEIIDEVFYRENKKAI